MPLKRVGQFFKGFGSELELRQVDIEANLYTVTLNNEFQFGIDWLQVAEDYGGSLGIGALTGPQAIGGGSLGPNAIGGWAQVTLPTVGFFGVYQQEYASVAVNALKQQGTVEVIAQPRIRTLNNQTATIVVGTDTPFFTENFQTSQTVSGNVTFLPVTRLQRSPSGRL